LNRRYAELNHKCLDLSQIDFSRGRMIGDLGHRMGKPIHKESGYDRKGGLAFIGLLVYRFIGKPEILKEFENMVV